MRGRHVGTVRNIPTYLFLQPFVPALCLPSLGCFKVSVVDSHCSLAVTLAGLLRLVVKVFYASRGEYLNYLRGVL